MAKYISTKKYDHNNGFSCAFRQWRAESHCNLLHGYALAFEFTFESDELDVRNWCVDFGSLKSLKGWLEQWFDHTTLVAEDDPQMELFLKMHAAKIINLRVMPAVGCEKMAEFVWEYADGWLQDNGYKPRVRLAKVQVWEHSGNSGAYEGDV